MTDKTTTGSDAVDLLPCPFCGCAVRFISNRDWHKLAGEHAEECVFDDDYSFMVPADDGGRDWLVAAWNRRALIAQARAAAPVKPTISLSRAGAECMSEDECISQDVDFSAYERGVADAIEACENIVGAARAAAPAVPTDLLNAEELAALHRFNECALDGEGYDVPKEMMQRLAEIGVVRRKSGAFYEHTEFGLRVLEGRAASTASSELRTVQELASAIWRDNYREESPRFEVLDTMHGVLSQIDNMVSGMSRRAAATAPTDELPACDAPKGPYADYSAEEVEAFAKEYARTIIATRTLSAPTATSEPVAQDILDAHRYRWLRSNNIVTNVRFHFASGESPYLYAEELDKAIDHNMGYDPLAAPAPQQAAPLTDAPGAHHLTAENVAAIIKDLREIEDGTTERPVGGRDIRTWAGVLARVIEWLSAGSATSAGDAREPEPDMLWLAEDPEVFANGPDDFANDYANDCLRPGEEAQVAVDCANRVSKRAMKISVIDKGDDESEVVWEWIDRAAMAATKEKKQ